MLHPPRKTVLRLATVLLALLPAACSDDPAPTLPELVTRDTIIRVPDDAPNLQTGIDQARAGDTVLVAPGVYRGEGNRDLLFHSRPIVLLSEAGPASTVIDCGGSPEDPHAGLVFERNGTGTLVRGFTIRGAYTSSGGAIYCVAASPTVLDCLIVGNYATDSGGAVRCKSASPRLIGCTIVGNGSTAGGALFAIANSSPVFERCILGFSTAGGAVFTSDAGSAPQLRCCNLYGNNGGDWTDTIAPQADLHGNLGVNPRFCPDGGFGLQSGSPCTAENSPCGERIGAPLPGCP